MHWIYSFSAKSSRHFESRSSLHSGVALPGQLGFGPGQSMAEIIDNIDYEASKSQ